MQLFTNNADSELNGAIATGTLSLTLKTGDGTKFPSPTGGDFFLVTLFEKVGATEVNHEIVKCTARTEDVLTVARAQEGTTAKAFGSASPIELRVTAASLSAKADLASPTFTGTVSGITATMVGAPAGSGNSTGTNTGDQDLSGKQAVLVSGTNIKTVNGTTLLGTGDLTIEGFTLAQAHATALSF